MLIWDFEFKIMLCVASLKQLHYASLSLTGNEWFFTDFPIMLQLKKYYQPRKSRRTVAMIVEGNKVPLYGAGSSLTVAQTGNIVIPLTLKFEILSRGNVVGKLVRTKHRRQISCPLVIDSSSPKPIKFKKNTCTYDWGPSGFLACCKIRSILPLWHHSVWTQHLDQLQCFHEFHFNEERKQFTWNFLFPISACSLM